MPRKNFNTTIDESTIEKINALAVNGKSKGEVVDMAVALLASPKENPNEEINRWFRETWARLDELPEVLLAAKRASSLGLPAPVSQSNGGAATVTAVGAPFNPRCLHCGENFGAWNRNASLCPDCKAIQHIGDPRDCPVCTGGGGI